MRKAIVEKKLAVLEKATEANPQSEALWSAYLAMVCPDATSAASRLSHGRFPPPGGLSFCHGSGECALAVP